MYSSGMLNFYQQDTGLILADADLNGSFGSVEKFLFANAYEVHDPVSNFCFAQNLYKAGLFEIEPYGASILALTPYQYVERLEEMLGDW